MKILLLSDIPPCKDFPAGIVLDQLCRFLPRGSIACFVVLYRALKARISPGLEWIPIQYTKRPFEAALSRLRARRLNQALHLALYYYNTISIRRIASEIVRYGRAFGADTLWCNLEGQSLIRLALPVARALSVPLLTQVFDPPTWELRIHLAHKITQTRLLDEFAAAIRGSRTCATASWPMAQRYAEDYGTRTVTFLPSLDPRLALPPAKEIHSGDQLTIGLAGQVYATKEWEALVTALDAVDWRIGHRDVHIRLLGRHRPPLSDARPGRIQFLGWHTQPDSIRLLSEADILYCPYWFDKVFETEARLSFPSKLTTYFAAGRPVLFHGPPYASAAVFLKDNEAGFTCHSNESAQIVDALTTLATNGSLYARLTHNGRTTFDNYLTLATLRRSFTTFLQVEEDFLRPVEQCVM
jgi:glycosyltransferase involved in cell wall biosynthesis